jgi:tRNA threonylcarbamoyl adenosine modification protein (Sua5/YciO/YrdC/YwlC family)
MAAVDLDADLDDDAAMEPAQLPGADDIDGVVEALLSGQVVVIPTDTVYGIAAIPTDAGAMARLFAAKGRGQDAPMAVLCASRLEALALVDPGCHHLVEPVAERWWPGPLTLVLPRRAGVELHLGDPEATVGVRVPDHPLVRAITLRVGPVAASSANRHGQPTAVTAEEARLAFGGEVAVVVDGGALAGRASTVIDATGPEWRVLREGPLPARDMVHPGEQPLL